jgi:hypothetical protein
VDRPMVFSLTNASRTAIAIDCGPSPFHFNIPVILTLSYAGTNFTAATNQSALEVIYMAPDGSLQEMPSTVDVRGALVTARLDHFSRYILGAITGGNNN